MGFVRRKVNIRTMPAVDSTPAGTVVVVGDLHANAVLLLFTLLKQGIVFNITGQQYHEFVHLAEKGGDLLSAEDLQQFYKIVDYLEIRNDIGILLLGDEVADRAKNPDLFIVELVIKLKKNAIDIIILLSNHGIELLDRSENGLPYSDTRLPAQYANSAHQLQKLMDRGLLSRVEFDRRLDQFYKPCLKVIAYFYGKEKEFFLFSHAPIGLQQVDNMAKEFDCVFNGYGISKLRKEIDCINDKFQKHLKNRQAHLLYDYGNLGHSSGAIDDAIWNRDRNKLNRPETLDGYKLRFVHGHDSSDKDKDPFHVINLDGYLGKAPNLNEEDYPVLLVPNAHFEAIDDCHAEGTANWLNRGLRAVLKATPDPFEFPAVAASTMNGERVQLERIESTPKMICTPGVYGEVNIPVLQCSTPEFDAWIFLKPSTAVVSDYTQQGASSPIDGDTFSRSNCRPSFFGGDTIQCEGEETQVFLKPRARGNFLETTNANLMLGVCILYLGKMIYDWAMCNSEGDNEPCCINIVGLEEAEKAFSTLESELCAISNSLSSKKNALEWNWAVEALEDCREALDNLKNNAGTFCPCSLDDIKLDIAALATDINEMLELKQTIWNVQGKTKTPESCFFRQSQPSMVLATGTSDSVYIALCEGKTPIIQGYLVPR